MEDGDEHPYALLWSMVDFTFTFTHTHNWLVMVAGRVSSQNIPVCQYTVLTCVLTLHDSWHSSAATQCLLGLATAICSGE